MTRSTFRSAATLASVALLFSGCGSQRSAQDVADTSLSAISSSTETQAPADSTSPTPAEPTSGSTATDAAGQTPAPPPETVEPAQATTTAVRLPDRTCTAATSGDVKLTLTSGGKDRTALLHIPPGYDGSTAVPLVLDLHGHFGNSRLSQSKHGFDTLADRDTVLVVYPQGLKQLDGGTGWSTGSPERDDGSVDDVAYIRDLLDLIEGQYCVDTDRIWATGHSNGGGMVGVLACDLADRIDAAAPVSGAFYPRATCQPNRQIPMLEVHGLDDAIVPYAGNGLLPSILGWLGEWAARNGCSATQPAPTTVALGNLSAWSNCAEPVEHIAVPGQGHDYPSGSAAAIWEFFQRTAN
jgi:polyhydroxybutyrate depolymerase